MSGNGHPSAVARVEAAISYLEQVGAGGPALSLTVAALDQVLRAATECADLAATVAPLAPQGRAALFAAASAVSDAVAGAITPEAVYFGLGNASALLTNRADAFHLDRVNHAAILSCQLAVELHRQALRRRGSPLLRALEIGRALDQPFTPETPIH